MRLLFDQNLSFRLCSELAAEFPGSSQARLLGLAEADDLTIFRRAGEGGYALVSQDADFAELASLYGPPPKVIWLRCGNRPTAYVADLLRSHAEQIRLFAEAANMTCLEVF